MNNAAACAAKLTALLKKLSTPNAPEFPDADDPIAVLVQSFLLWEADTASAIKGYEKIRAQVVDFNELRVTLPLEVAEMLGTRYPQGQERAERLRASLRDLYLREHAMDLSRIAAMGKRDIRRYIETLDGMTPYVANRVLLIAFDAHGVPVDQKLRRTLIDEGAADESADVDELTAWMGRQIKASDGRDAHLALQAWADKTGRSRSRRAPRRGRKSSSGGASRSSRKKAGSASRHE